VMKRKTKVVDTKRANTEWSAPGLRNSRWCTEERRPKDDCQRNSLLACRLGDRPPSTIDRLQWRMKDHSCSETEIDVEDEECNKQRDVLDSLWIITINQRKLNIETWQLRK
jgi:hypothetical protein